MARKGLILLALLAVGADREVHADTMKTITLKVMTFNILHGATMNGNGDLDVVAKVITEADPDLVALQEVDVRTDRVHGLDLARELAQRTGLESRFGKAMDYAGGEYGVALLSRFPILESKVLALPCTDGNEPRVAMASKVALPRGPHISVVVTHLDNLSAQDRAAQARAINREFGTGEGPRLLAGDFNATPESEAVAILKEAWIPTDGVDAPATFPSGRPTSKIDYILFAPREDWHVKETQTIQNTVASDHFALISILELGAR